MSEYVDLARAAIAAGLAGEPPSELTGPAASGTLAAPGAAFVTLTINGRLRGCIGSLAPRRPLGQDIAAHARAAAFSDPRFAPLAPDEFPAVQIEVSILSPATPLAVASRSEAEARLRPAIDGVVLTSGSHRATFLPQVWEQLPEPHLFLSQLLAKAGLEPSSWPADITLATYTVQAHTQ